MRALKIAMIATFEDLNDNDFVPKSSEPVLFNQEEFTNLIRDLNLSKVSSELLASRLNDQNLQQQGTEKGCYKSCSAKYKIWTSLMDYLCPFKTGKRFFRSAEWIHEVWLLCCRDRKDKTNHRKIKNRSVWEQLNVADKNFIHIQLLRCEKIIFHPLHIELGLMKQFVKVLDKSGQCF